MHSRLLTVLFVLGFLCSVAFATPTSTTTKKPSKSFYSIRGVLDGLTGKELTGTAIQLVGSRSFSQSVSVRGDGTFILTDVPSGAYSLIVISPYAIFDRLKIVCTKGVVTATSDHTGNALEQPLHLEPLSRSIFEEREEFDLRSLLTNPMVMMIGFGLMTYLMTSMSSQQKEMLADLSAEERAEIPALFQALLPKEKTATDLEDETHFSPLRRSSQAAIAASLTSSPAAASSSSSLAPSN